MIVADREALSAYLLEAQAARLTEIRCELSSEFSAHMHDAALMEALITGLPMAQGIQHRILRSRGRGVVLTAKVRYRDGVRMLDGSALTEQEAIALELARAITAEVGSGNEESRFCYLYEWVCRNIRYVHTAAGKKGYENLVGASGAMMERQANCQGFADVLYLLCGLCGIRCAYRCGQGMRRLHVWNAVCLDGEWREVDASKGARALSVT